MNGRNFLFSISWINGVELVHFLYSKTSYPTINQVRVLEFENRLEKLKIIVACGKQNRRFEKEPIWINVAFGI